MQRKTKNGVRQASVQLLTQLRTPRLAQPVVAPIGEPQELEQLKTQLLDRHLGAVRDVHAHAWLRRAAAEATSLAWSTSYPLLLLPELMDEKLAVALKQAVRQRNVTLRSRAVLSLSA